MAESPSELQFEIEKLERKHAEHPEGRFFVPLANAYRKMGDIETAEALLRSGVERHPDYLSAHIVLGRCLADRGAVNEAQQEFRFVLSQDPQNLIALRTLGELAVADGRPGEAAEWYQELLAVDPLNEDARQALDSLSDAPASPEMESEFRSGAGWWEPGADADTEQPPLEEPAAPGAETTAPTGHADHTVGAEPEYRPAIEPSEEPADEARGEAAAWLESQAEHEPFAPAYADDEQQGTSSAEERNLGFSDAASSEVVTETIAELYARQGLHERAAGVYRELIRRRGGDAALEQRLAEIERLGREEEEQSTDLTLADEEALVTPSLDADDDPFASSFAQGFTTAYEENLEALPHAEAFERGEDAAESTEEPAGPPAGAATSAAAAAVASDRSSIVRFLADLAAWRPAQDSAVGAPEDRFVETEPEALADDWGAPGEADMTALDLEAEPWETTTGETTEPSYVEPWESVRGEEAGQESDELPYLEQVSDTGAAAGTGSAEDEPFPWELPGAAPMGEETSEEQSAPALDPFFVDDVEPRSITSEQSLPEAAPAPEQRQEAETAPRPGASDPAEDEDLESFQAWLRSLKR